MKCFIALGSNLGNAKDHLEKAASSLKSYLVRVSPIFQTPALLTPGAPEEWRRSFLNAVVEIEWPGSPQELLLFLKQIETKMGRKPSPRWSPRVIDLDILTFGEKNLQEEHLQIPHAEIYNRSFVLDPLKFLSPHLQIPGYKMTPLARSRELPSPSPLWMGILNLTEDSFSDGGQLTSTESLKKRFQIWDEAHVQIFDFGAQSTRPGAKLGSAVDEWQRLEPALDLAQEFFQGRFFRPRLSVDTYHPEVAKKAAAKGVDIFNDVSGLADRQWIEVLKNSSADYVLMHSLSVPADPQQTLPSDSDPVQAVKEFFLQRLHLLDASGIPLDRVILDPGLGFGKTAFQSLCLLKRIHEFFDLPCRLLVGPSRKSFLKLWSESPAAERDFESLGVSLQLARRGVDILRVHEAQHHAHAFQTFQETSE